MAPNKPLEPSRRGFLGILGGALASHALNRVYFIPRSVRLYQAVPKMNVPPHAWYGYDWGAGNPRANAVVIDRVGGQILQYDADGGLLGAGRALKVTMADIQAIELEHFKSEIPRIFDSGRTLFDQFKPSRPTLQEIVDQARRIINEPELPKWMDLLPDWDDFDA